MYDVTAGLIRAGHQVTMLALNTPKHRQPADALAHLGPNMRLVTVDIDTRLSPWKALRNLVSSDLPYNVERFVSQKAKAQLAQLLQEEEFDVVQLEGTFVAWYARHWISPDGAAKEPSGKHLPPLVLRAHNVEYTIWEMLARRASNPLKKWYLQGLAQRLKQFEEWMLCRFDAIAAITEADQQRFEKLGPHPPIQFIPAGVNLERLPTNLAVAPKPQTLFIIGSLDWLPNQEGVQWFLTNVWPKVHAQLPDLELHIAGKNPPEWLQQSALPNVFMHGFVESAADFMQRYDVMLVPLLSGGGMRVKIIEGMALQKCIISTSLGAEGIHVRNGHDILVRDTPEEWIDLLVRYYQGELQPAAIGQAAADTIARLYDNRRIVEQFVALYHSVQRSESL